jgi:predicted carbohydrate-binding protein with CBM48
VFEPDEELIGRVVRQLRRPVTVDAGLDARVMEQIARLPARRPGGLARAAWRWLTRPRTIRLSPLGALAIAAVLVAIGLWRPDRPSSPVPASARAFGFVVVAPRAATVSLVGDFNDWDAARTPMQRTRKDESVWTAVIPLTPGRYRYAFLVNGVSWLADPAAPAARDDEFGAPSSVVTVGGS